jgi:hypothetical protein
MFNDKIRKKKSIEKKTIKKTKKPLNISYIFYFSLKEYFSTYIVLRRIKIKKCPCPNS